MKKLILTIALLLATAMTMQGAAAQVQPGDGAISDDIDGLTSGYSRSYNDSDTRIVTLYAYTFESSDQADTYLGQLREEMETELGADRESFDELKFEDMEAIDNDGFELSITSEEEGVGLKALVFSDEEMIFVVMALDSEIETASETAEDFANFILNAEMDDEDVSFNRDGTSTGGVFDRMPAADDELVSDDATVTDSDLFEEEE